jgi:hypothetical protein
MARNRPRNQLYLDQEVAGIWRPFADYTSVEDFAAADYASVEDFGETRRGAR